MLEKENGKDMIIAVGLNPAWQKTLIFSELKVYHVNRAENLTHMASGKGINFVRALDIAGGNGKVYQFTGGITGENICKYLDREKIRHCSIKVEPATRICTTCLCLKSGRMTELIEPSGHIKPEDAERFMVELSSSISQARGIALCGTFPPGVSGEFYALIAEKANNYGIPVLLDAWKDIRPVLNRDIDILKINDEEIKALTGRDKLKDAIKFCFKKFSVKIVAVTAGPRNAFLAEKNNLWSFKIPKLDKVVNPIGAGDTVSAIFFSEYLKGRPLYEAFRAGLAAASASCLRTEAAVFDPAESEKIEKQIVLSLKHLKDS